MNVPYSQKLVLNLYSSPSVEEQDIDNNSSSGDQVLQPDNQEYRVISIGSPLFTLNRSDGKMKNSQNQNFCFNNPTREIQIITPEENEPKEKLLETKKLKKKKILPHFLALQNKLSKFKSDKQTLERMSNEKSNTVQINSFSLESGFHSMSMSQYFNKIVYGCTQQSRQLKFQTFSIIIENFKEKTITQISYLATVISIITAFPLQYQTVSIIFLILISFLQHIILNKYHYFKHPIRYAQVILLFLISQHFIACIWNYVYFGEKHADDLQQYFFSLFWVFSKSIGFIGSLNNMVTNSISLQIISILIQIYGFICTAYFFSIILSYALQENGNQEIIQKMGDILKINNIDSVSLKHYTDTFKSTLDNKQRQEQYHKILSLMPEQIQTQFLRNLKESFSQKLDKIVIMTQNLKQQLQSDVQHLFIQPKKRVVFDRTDLIQIHNNVYDQSESQINKEIQQEYPFILHHERNQSFLFDKPCLIFQLSENKFLQHLHRFPVQKEIFLQKKDNLLHYLDIQKTRKYKVLNLNIETVMLKYFYCPTQQRGAQKRNRIKRWNALKKIFEIQQFVGDIQSQMTEQSEDQNPNNNMIEKISAYSPQISKEVAPSMIVEQEYMQRDSADNLLQSQQSEGATFLRSAFYKPNQKTALFGSSSPGQSQDLDQNEGRSSTNKQRVTFYEGQLDSLKSGSNRSQSYSNISHRSNQLSPQYVLQQSVSMPHQPSISQLNIRSDKKYQTEIENEKVSGIQEFRQQKSHISTGSILNQLSSFYPFLAEENNNGYQNNWGVINFDQMCIFQNYNTHNNYNKVIARYIAFQNKHTISTTLPFTRDYSLKCYVQRRQKTIREKLRSQLSNQQHE